MVIGGIICECNPLHVGHARLLDYARAHADAVFCAVSGYFTERGESALCLPSVRAEALMRCGADAVGEIPFPFASASAEGFARGGIQTLRAMGVNALFFGSECGDVNLLKAMARFKNTEAFKMQYVASLGLRDGSATAFHRVMSEAFPDAPKLGPNDVLGLSYLSELDKLGLLDGEGAWTVETLKRNGDFDTDGAPDEGCLPSAGFLRRTVLTLGWDACRAYMPTPAFDVFSKTAVSPENEAFDRASRYFFATKKPGDLDGVPYLGGGLGNALIKIAQGTADGTAWYLDAVTKQYTESRVRRGVVMAMAQVTDADMNEDVAYVRLFALSKKGQSIFSARRKTPTEGTVTVTTVRGIPEKGTRQRATADRVRLLYETLCHPDYKQEIFTPVVEG